MSNIDAKANGDGESELDAMLELLADRRRRYALYYLREQERAVGVDELTRRIAERDERTRARDRDRVRIELLHKHLPKMEASGVIERDGDAIRLGRSADSLDPYLHIAAELERPP
ncbi:DUF7344 domain-containing protein [Haladaptatus salinisoli]|uniref:DUF7344 domain-containing protein n=1 Tax=Haladaptatus salinisoli TaxID=2884876 RepID=UPI001D09C1A9|nr:hypothetical protein [Haladaptatus salinisoli]